MEVWHRSDYLPHSVYAQVPTEVNNVFSQSMCQKIDIGFILGRGRKVFLECCNKFREHDLLNRPCGAGNSVDRMRHGPEVRLVGVRRRFSSRSCGTRSARGPRDWFQDVCTVATTFSTCYPRNSKAPECEKRPRTDGGKRGGNCKCPPGIHCWKLAFSAHSRTPDIRKKGQISKFSFSSGLVHQRGDDLSGLKIWPPDRGPCLRPDWDLAIIPQRPGGNWS